MKGSKALLKKLAACILIGVMLISMAAPASAATLYQKSKTITVKAGQSFHILNNNISRNGLRKYQVKVTVPESGARYDMVTFSAGNLQTVKNSNKTTTWLVNNPAQYLKNNSSANKGMLCCIRVNKGSVTLKVTYITSRKSMNLTAKKMGASHQTLKGVTVPAGKKVLFQQTGSNISKPSIVISSQSGSVTRRGGSKTFENYTFNSGSLSYRYYLNGVMQSAYSKNRKYDSQYGANGYVMVRIPDRNTGWWSSKIGKVNYYFPSDYVNMKFQIKTA